MIASWVCLVVAVLAYWVRNARAQGAAKAYDVLDAIVWHKAMLAVARRESGNIEQDADVVMFLWREDYYKPETDRKGITECIIAKQRHGPVGTVELRWNPEYVTFENLAKEVPA